MNKEELIKAEREEIERLKIAITKSVNDIKLVDTTNVVLKNAPPTKSSNDKSISK